MITSALSPDLLKILWPSVKFCSYPSWINSCMEGGTGFCNGTLYNKLFFCDTLILIFWGGGKVVFLVVKHWTHGNYVLPLLQITEALLKERDKQAKWNGIPLLLQKLYEHSHPNSDFSQCQSILKVLSTLLFLKARGYFVVAFFKAYCDHILTNFWNCLHDSICELAGR